MIVKLLLTVLVACVCSGCTMQKYAAIRVKSLKETNGGKPFYVLARGADAVEYSTDDYQTIVTKALQAQEDDSVLERKKITPGQTDPFYVELPENKKLAIYFLFTNPDGPWKHPIEWEGRFSPGVLFKLGENKIETVEIYSRIGIPQ